MDPLTVLILGIVQGITEWVPISSKTQDALVYLKFLHGDPNLVVPIILYLHVGTIVAATIYFRKELKEMLDAFLKNPSDISTHANSKIGFLFTALLLTAVVGLPLLFLEKIFFPTLDAGLLFAAMGLGLIVTGILLLKQKGSGQRKLTSVTWKDGVLIGLLQGLSILPGVSRSGTSTTGLIWRGFDSENSFHLSFLLSIPTVIFAELIFYVGGSLYTFPVTDGLMLALSSFIFGYLTLDALLKLMRKISLAYLAIAMGLIIIAAGLFGAG